MTAKENAIRIIRFDKPRYVMSGLPTYSLCYNGCHHEGYSDGGYFCAPDQGMPFPQAHIEAFQEAVRRYGQYPLSQWRD
jgi:hypothetical protein